MCQSSFENMFRHSSHLKFNMFPLKHPGHLAVFKTGEVCNDAKGVRGSCQWGLVGLLGDPVIVNEGLRSIVVNLSLFGLDTY